MYCLYSFLLIIPHKGNYEDNSESCIFSHFAQKVPLKVISFIKEVLGNELFSNVP